MQRVVYMPPRRVLSYATAHAVDPRDTSALEARLRHRGMRAYGLKTRNTRQAEAHRAERCMVYVADNENHGNRTSNAARVRRSLRCAAHRMLHALRCVL